VASAKPEGGEGLASSKNLHVIGRHQLVMAWGHVMYGYYLVEIVF